MAEICTDPPAKVQYGQSLIKEKCSQSIIGRKQQQAAIQEERSTSNACIRSRAVISGTCTSMYHGELVEARGLMKPRVLYRDGDLPHETNRWQACVGPLLRYLTLSGSRAVRRDQLPPPLLAISQFYSVPLPVATSTNDPSARNQTDHIEWRMAAARCRLSGPSRFNHVLLNLTAGKK